jgi:hypothetical protein
MATFPVAYSATGKASHKLIVPDNFTSMLTQYNRVI